MSLADSRRIERLKAENHRLRDQRDRARSTAVALEQACADGLALPAGMTAERLRFTATILDLLVAVAPTVADIPLRTVAKALAGSPWEVGEADLLPGDVRIGDDPIVAALWCGWLSGSGMQDDIRAWADELDGGEQP